MEMMEIREAMGDPMEKPVMEMETWNQQHCQSIL